jgi:hypothetical protein
MLSQLQLAALPRLQRKIGTLTVTSVRNVKKTRSSVNRSSVKSLLLKRQKERCHMPVSPPGGRAGRPTPKPSPISAGLRSRQQNNGDVVPPCFCLAPTAYYSDAGRGGSISGDASCLARDPIMALDVPTRHAWCQLPTRVVR